MSQWPSQARVNKSYFPVDVIEGIIRGVFDDVLDALESADFRYPPLFTSALLGRNQAYAVAERILVTVIGSNAVRFFRSFFTDISVLTKPFDFSGSLRRFSPKKRVYCVKVVSSPKAFNSTTAGRVAQEAARRGYLRPIILTLHGWWEGMHRRDLGGVVWMDGVASWAWVSGMPSAYSMFARTVFRVAREYRGKVMDIIRNKCR